MSYIGNSPVYQAFITDSFSGNGSTVAFTMSVAPANTASVLVAVSGVLQDPSTYSVIGTLLTFSGAPPTGTGNISVRYLGVPASNIVSTAYRTVTEVTATAGQTVFTPASYVVGFLNVYRNGVCLGAADYTATSGTTVVLAVGANLNDLLRFESFSVSSVLNAIPAQSAAVVATYLAPGAASQAFLDVTGGGGTGALKLPVGTTAQRPTGAAGLIRQNATTGNPEWWDATTSTWLQFSQPAGYSVEYLVVAGGGSGGATNTGGSSGGGGGGAGGLLTTTAAFSSGVAYTITVGAGGAPTLLTGANGSNSSISTINTAIGGGGGGGSTGAPSLNGQSGGAGGGAGNGGGTSAFGGSGTSGQGFAGGAANSAVFSTPNYPAAGGGGASAVGATVSVSTTGGNGGAGVSNSISGSSVNYAGGGGGSTFSGGTPGTGGLGGGGAGANGGAIGTSGTANTGGGGGGASQAFNSGAGGSGIVVLRYLGSQRGTGGTVTSSGGSTIHTFTSSGTYNA